MPTFSDGDDSVDAHIMDDHPLSSTGDMRVHLQNLLDSKEKQLQQAGTLGQQLLAQRMELEERIRQLQDMDLDGGSSDDEDLDVSVRERYRELADTIKSWDTENEQLSSVFGTKLPENDTLASPHMEISRTEVERAKASAAGPSAAQSSRRAKNAAHRADDVEFAFEIGSGLLTEVRRLQSLLAERDKAIQDMKEEKDDLEKTIESLRTALRSQEQSADKFKEENWNLEVTLQELRTQLSDSQASVQRLEGEHKRLTKVLTVARESVDQHKNDAERHQNSFLELKAKHETDVAQARKHAASLQRDKSDLQQTLDTMKAEAAKANRRFPRFGSPLTPNGAHDTDMLTPNNQDEDDVFGTTGGASTNNRKKYDNSGLFPGDSFGSEFGDSSPEPSPSKPFLAPNHPSNEIEALQQRLAHAQRQINTLKGTLQREKELKIEYRRKLDSSPGYSIEEEEEPEEEADQSKPSKPRLTPYRVGGRGRGRGRGKGGMTLIQRLGMAAASPSSDYNDDEPRDTSPPPPVPPLPAAFAEEEADEEEEEEPGVEASPSLQIVSNRTSVDGMDPAFANVLRRSSSSSSLPQNESPLRASVVARVARGGTFPRRSRGGAAYQDVRPPSLVGQPEALAAELGLGFGAAPVQDQPADETVTAPTPVIETAEFGCQTDFGELESLPPPPIHVTPATTEMAVQADPEPIPVTITAEASLQTDKEPVPILPVIAETGVQHEEVGPVRVWASSMTNTEPELAPDSPPTPDVAQAEVQTPRVQSAEIDVQTVSEPAPILIEKADMDIQTLPPVLPVMAEMETQTATPVLADVEVQVTETSAPHLYTDATSMAGSSSYGDSSGDTTVRPQLISLPLSGIDEDDDFDDITETGSFIETDAEDFLDARQSMEMMTPTDSIDDYHSIMTVSDNDFSESEGEDDTESIKASHLPNGVSAVSSAVSVTAPSLPSVSPLPPALTYDSKAVATELEEELVAVEEPAPAPMPVPEPVPVPEPKPELKEISVQTDEWSPPSAPVPVPNPVTAPPTPASGQVPALYRVGPNSQHFQFISPPSSAGPTTVNLPIVAAPSPNTIVRDSNTTFIARPRTSHSDRRRSIESTLSSVMDDLAHRSRTPSNVTNLIDKSRPPMMVLPPPPRQPPPPNTMLPPPFIPEKRLSHDIPPPRPSSPPPADLIQRATTPTFGSVLSVPGGRPFGLRQHGSSMPPSQQGLRQLPSTSSFRSAANAANRASLASPTPSAMSFGMRERERRELSSTSLNSGRNSLGSQRSSLSSDHHMFNEQHQRLPAPQASPDRTADMSARGPGGASTDPAVIHAITQTMIGEFLYKYTRRAIGKGHGSSRHKRFFWVHPYTRTLYWSSADPGSSNVSESSAKSAYIEAVRSVLDPNPMPPGIYQYSVVVSTPQREMKFTAPTKDRHDIWLNALNYLLTRPSAMPVGSPGGVAPAPLSPMSMDRELPEDEGQPPRVISSPQSQRSGRSTRTGLSVEAWNITPRGQRSQSQLSLGGSMGKRSGTPAAEYLRWAGHDHPHSPTKDFEHIPGQDDEDADFELHDDTLSDSGFEGLENVRACCDGRHTVGRSGKIDHHHHHHHHHFNSQREPSAVRGDHLDAAPQDTARPSSPAWSFRSRAGSSTSHDGAGFFSRFGTKRSTTTTVKSVQGIFVGANDQ
ncbi:hypothetical protein B0H21DRAFT_891679 [Amylocystis lapponica]|nr:hypothetical protein B0H21DRAFT_891679 [Amylocystis lapponica]